VTERAPRCTKSIAVVWIIFVVLLVGIGLLVKSRSWGFATLAVGSLLALALSVFVALSLVECDRADCTPLERFATVSAIVGLTGTAIAYGGGIWRWVRRRRGD
jgi:membrane-bound metal-dependent hydrolase YbcI (DUF457 family)